MGPHGEREGDGEPDDHGDHGQLNVLSESGQNRRPMGHDPLPPRDGDCVRGCSHDTISFEIRSNVRMPRYRWPSLATTATCVRDVTIESRAWRSELAAVT